MTIEEWLKQQFPGLTDVAALARGGQKVVYAARHPNDGDVVLKVIMPGQDLSRIEREILAVQTVNSSRVPRILEVGTVSIDGTQSLWLREQRVVGASVRHHLAASGALAAREVARLVLHILEALAEAERVRIVHRDVKPENVMRGDDGSYWLLDFGISRHLDLQSLTQTAALMGPSTIGYAPPEQYRNFKRDVDARADLFALSVTAVECLTGKHPYKDGARDLPDIIRRVESVPLVAPAVDGDVDGGFRDLILAMGQKRIDPRPATAAYALDWMRDVTAKCGF